MTQPGPADDGPGLAADGPADVPAAPRRDWRRVALVAVLALGLCGLAIAAAGISSQLLPRRFTAAQQRRIEAWEVGKRWRTLPQGMIFPATVTYHLPGYVLDESQNQGLRLRAHRLGVSDVMACSAGAGPAAAAILRHDGCTAVLRATYVDSTGSMVATVGVAVLPDAAAAARAMSKLTSAGPSGLPGTVRPAAVPGTLAARFDDAARQLSWNAHTGPYVIMTTVGYADGRPRVHVISDPYVSAEMKRLDRGLGAAVSGVLGRPPATPRCPGAPGC